jgi:Spy/CpxP family protein refolding chaperone
MIKRNLATKIITAAIAGSLLFTSNAMASSPNTSKNTHKFSARHKVFKKPDLQSFVEEKIITQEQANKIEAFFEKRREENKAELDNLKKLSKEEREDYLKEHYKTRPDIFGDLVSSKIITQDQADKIKESISRRYDNKLQDVLKNEVSKGTIKQEQLDKINQFLVKKKEAKRLQRDKIKALPESERKAYWEAYRRNKTDLLSELVSEGIITEQQKEALSKVLPMHSYNKKPGQ